jgi:hypothetical protein
MQALSFALRNLWRDLKSGELSVLLLALTVAVLSLTAVGFFTSRISQGVRAQASEVLAADLRIESDHAIRTDYFDEARQRGLKNRRSAVVRNRDIQRQSFPARLGARGQLELSAARLGAHRRCAVRRRTQHRPNPAHGRGVGRCANHRAIELAAGLADAARRGHVHGHASARLPARSGDRLRQPCARGAHQRRRRRIDAVDPARQPRDLCGAVRRAAGRDRGAARRSEGAKVAGRADPRRR